MALPNCFFELLCIFRSLFSTSVASARQMISIPALRRGAARTVWQRAQADTLPLSIGRKR